MSSHEKFQSVRFIAIGLFGLFRVRQFGIICLPIELMFPFPDLP
jgi:hypothetical protein